MPIGAEKQDIKSLLPEELEVQCKAMGLPGFRAKQVFQWLGRGVTSFEEMSNLSKDLRARLEEKYEIPHLTMLKKQVSALDGTVKFLWQLPDGESVETVLMRYKHGNTVCISSQVGCRMGCAFCASTIGGKVRDLRRRCWTRSFARAWRPRRRYPTLSSWVSGSRWIILIM
jgi:23S rRNA (adenine2503-C2)-methyltransferase